ncbi:MAG TPA: phage portal protein [Flavisolibacter sp.]|nr:phage portal protein [Flavisolibacter sp.]
MELSELESLLDTPKELVEKVIHLTPDLPDYVFDLEPEDHKVVKDLNHRPWRDVDVATGVLDSNGNMTYRVEKRDVHRIPSSTRKQIIEWAVNMNVSGGIERDYTIRDGVSSDPVMVEMIDKTWDDNKLDYIAQEIDRLKKSYTQCLVVWYSVPAEEGFWDGIAPAVSKFKMRCSIFSPEDGSVIIPIYDQYRDQIACARKYVVSVGGKDVNKLDLHLKGKTITYTEVSGTWEPSVTVLPFNKANYVFHGQKRPEYADILPKDERIEEIDSDTADENQISAFPILAATGEIISSTGGGTKNTRKSVQLENGADLKYVEAKGSQQSATDERKNLRQDIYDETATPQISFEQIKGSSNLPGVTIEMMFLPATNKARKNQQGDLGMEWQRHLNLLKACMAEINLKVRPSVTMSIKPKFKIVLPRNLTEEYNRIIALVSAGLMSVRTAVTTLGFVDNIDEEIAAIEAEVAKRALALRPANTPTE